MNRLLISAGFLVLLGTGCVLSPTPEDGTLPPDAWCYTLDGEPAVMVKIEPAGTSTMTLEGQTIWHDTLTVIEPGYDPETVIGRIENDQFFYADGSGFTFRANVLEGFGEGLEQMMGTRTTCPEQS